MQSFRPSIVASHCFKEGLAEVSLCQEEKEVAEQSQGRPDKVHFRSMAGIGYAMTFSMPRHGTHT